MEANDEQNSATPEGQTQSVNGAAKTEVQRVDDEKNPDEKDLKRSFIFGSAPEPVKDGTGMGGHKFGEDNHPPTGDDKNNPSQNAGYSNAYLAKTEPSEEYTDNNNFKVKSQEGEPNYQQVAPLAPGPDFGLGHHEHAGPGDLSE